MNYIIITFLAIIISELLWIILYIHKANGNIIIGENGEKTKKNKDTKELDEDINTKPKVKGINKINVFQVEDFDKGL